MQSRDDSGTAWYQDNGVLYMHVLDESRSVVEGWSYMLDKSSSPNGQFGDSVQAHGLTMVVGKGTYV